MCNMYLSTIVYNVPKAISNISIPDENIAIQNECCFRWAVPLKHIAFSQVKDRWKTPTRRLFSHL